MCFSSEIETGQLQGDAGEQRCQEVVQQGANGFGDEDNWLYPSLASYVQGFSDMAKCLGNDKSEEAIPSEPDSYPASSLELSTPLKGKTTRLVEEAGEVEKYCPTCRQTLDPRQISWKSCRTVSTGFSFKFADIKNGIQNGCRVCQAFSIGISGFATASHKGNWNCLKDLEYYEVELVPSAWTSFKIQMSSPSNLNSPATKGLIALDIFTTGMLLMPEPWDNR